MAFSPVWVTNPVKKNERVDVFKQLELRTLTQAASSIIDVSRFQRMYFFVHNSIDAESVTLSIAILDSDNQANQLMLYNGEKYDATATNNPQNAMMITIPKQETTALYAVNTAHTWLDAFVTDKLTMRVKANGSVAPTSGTVSVFLIGVPH